jgi:hypothetical protein
LFFSSDIIGDLDIFSLTNSGFLLCIERVKEFCKSQGYNNVAFLEMGKIILLAIKVSRKWMEEKERLPLIDW